MMPSFMELSRQDILLYYGGTFCRIDLEKIKKTKDELRILKYLSENGYPTSGIIWGKLRDVGATGLPSGVTCLFASITISSNGGKQRMALRREISIPLIEPIPIDFPVPATGFRNWKTGTLYLNRTTARQNKKGAHPDNMPVDNFIFKLADIPNFPRSLLAQPFNWGVDNIGVLLNHNPVSFQHAVRAVRSGKAVSRAFSPHMCVGVGLKDESPSIWLGDSYVGRAVNSKQIRVDVPALFQETADYLRDIRCGITIKE